MYQNQLTSLKEKGKRLTKLDQLETEFFKDNDNYHGQTKKEMDELFRKFDLKSRKL